MMQPSIAVRSLDVPDPLADPQLAHDLQHRYLLWDAWVAGSRRVDIHPVELSRELHASAVEAAVGVARAISNVGQRAYDDARELESYGLHPEVVRLARASHDAGDRGAAFRVDLLLDESGRWQACEVNADCPGGYNEALALPTLARRAGYVLADNPTYAIEALADYLAREANAPGGEPGAVALIFATAYAEDLQVCALLQHAIEARGARALLSPATTPTLVRGRFCVRGTPVRVLYRYFPAEYMEGQRNVGLIADQIAAGKLRTVSSFEHIFAQSKLAYARAWSLLPQLDVDDQRVVRDHIPGSYDLAEVPRDVLIGERDGWVIKRALGRVGDQVYPGTLFDPDAWLDIVDESRVQRAGGERWIAQRFVRQRPVPTPWGDRYITLGAYVLDGRFTGYFARVTPESHVSHDALCLPVFVGAPS